MAVVLREYSHLRKRKADSFQGMARSKITLDSMSEGSFAQEFLLGSKADSVANCFHKRSASLLTRAGTWMETPT
jgi:hypothetical protein